MDIRVVEGAEALKTATRVFELSLGEEFGDEGRAAFIGYAEASRTLGSFVDGRQVATASSYPTDLSVPGGALVDVHAVTGVGTLPTNTRQGHGRGLLTRQLQEAKAAGSVACVLEASESPLYGRYGYGPATTRGIAVLQSARSSFLTKVLDPGHFDYADGHEAVMHFAGPLFDEWRRQRPGQVGRPPQTWALQLVDVPAWRVGGAELSWVFHVDASGTPDGYVGYRIVNRWDNGLPASEARITDLVAVDQDVRALLFRFVLDQPLVEFVNVTGVPEDDPLVQRLVDPRRVRTVQRDDGLWVRLLDIPAALRARRWFTDGEIVLQVGDNVLGGVAGRWRVTAAGGVATVTETGDPADLVMGVAEISMIWLGGVTVRTLVGAGRIAATSAEVADLATVLFRGVVQPNHVGEF